MATVIMLKKGQLNIEKALKKMDWDTEKFEEELEMLAKTQPPKIQEKIRKQYNRYMAQCGWPMELVVVSESKRPVKVKTKQPKVPDMGVPRMTQQVEIKLDSEKENQSQTTTALATIPPISVSTEEPKEVGNKETDAPIPLATQEPDPNVWTLEQIEEAKLVGQEPIPQETKPNETEIKTPERKELHGYIVMSDALQVKNLLKTMNVLVDEATFKLTPKGLTLRAMDPSRVAMIDLVIPRENCTEHLCNEEIKFCFSIGRYLDPTLKNITKNDALRLDVRTGVIDKMITRLTGKLTRQFSMTLLEVSDEEVPMPKIIFNYSARLVLENLNTLFKDLEDHVRIIGTQDGLTFEQIGDIETFTSTLQKGDETVLNIEAKEDTKATYSVSYLKELLKALNLLTDSVEVSYSTDMPMRISAELEHLGTVNFWVAPRIESE